MFYKKRALNGVFDFLSRCRIRICGRSGAQYQQVVKRCCQENPFGERALRLTNATEREIFSAVRTVGIHVGLVILCITYIIGGAWLFYSLERPMELMIKEKTIKNLAYEKHNLLDNAIKLASHYEGFNPISASIFENEIDDLWTSSSAILFTATTLVPVGYGIVAPVTYSGRCCLIVYAIFGIPLALATMANLGKFVCAYLLRFLKKESIVMASITFISLLLLYPLLGSLIICISSSLSWLDSLYFCIMTIFMIGYGDMGFVNYI
uniref:Ion_trans_2 domain-containing protein n=1 Tax=Ascaris lumbricoides TaxID=6252 RepID=A0A0M3INF6_ASCLU